MICKGTLSRASSNLLASLILLFLAAVILVGSGSILPANSPAEPQKQLIPTAFGKLPLSFEKNLGQTDSRVRFLSRGGGYTLFLNSTEAVLVLRPAEKTGVRPVPSEAEGSQQSGDTGAVLRMKLVGANPVPDQYRGRPAGMRPWRSGEHCSATSSGRCR